jgi:hypothetical protein
MCIKNEILYDKPLMEEKWVWKVFARDTLRGETLSPWYTGFFYGVPVKYNKWMKASSKFGKRDMGWYVFGNEKSAKAYVCRDDKVVGVKVKGIIAKGSDSIIRAMYLYVPSSVKKDFHGLYQYRS